MEIGKQAFTSLQRVLRRRAPRVSANKIWLQVHRELGIGSRVGKYLELTPDDREQLRKAVHQATGLDPLHDDLEGDRMQMALRSSNEKLSPQQVFGEQIQLFRLQQPIPLRGGSALTPPGCHLATTPDQVDTSGLDAVVVVENGAAFLHWAHLCADTAICRTLALYRGHGRGARQALKLLQRLRGQALIHAAVDFDPAGFRIALSLKADSLLVPENYFRILQEPNLNKPEVFEKQNTRASDTGIPPGWRTAWEWIHQHRVAVTQESMLTRHWKMVTMYNRNK